MPEDPMAAAIRYVIEEREYQIRKWGSNHDATHTPEEWINILTVYLGKTAKETNVFEGSEEKFMKRLIQLAAISVAAIEAICIADTEAS